MRAFTSPGSPAADAAGDALPRPAGYPSHPIVLVVDDDWLVGSTIGVQLEEEGFRPAVFASGRAALQYLAAGGEAAAILLDWQMPEIDGAGVIRELHARGVRLPVIVFTADPTARDVAIAAGATDFLEKSKGFAVVVARLRHTLGR